MSELPRHPDLDQLRRQARELLRAAAAGEQQALARLRAHSDQVTLSAAQLALAREHGFASWAELRAEVERRRAVPAQPSAAGAYWSLSGVGAITTMAGKLSPSVLIAGPDRAELEGSLAPSAQTLAAHGHIPEFADVTGTDDRGARYSVRLAGMSGESLSLRLQPAPADGCVWLDLRSQAGPACRLLRSERSAVQVGPAALAAGTAAERELSQLALWVIQLEFDEAGPAARAGRCSTVLAKVAQLRQSGELDPASELPGAIAGLCDVLTGSGSASGTARLPARWSAMLDAAQRTDGLPYSLDIPAALPPLDGAAVQLRTLVSEPGSWRVYFVTRPGWWIYNEDRSRKRAALQVQARDDRGGMYLDIFGGSFHHAGTEELALRFRPRLDPLARALTLTFTGPTEQASATFDLKPE